MIVQRNRYVETQAMQGAVLDDVRQDADLCPDEVGAVWAAPDAFVIVAARKSVPDPDPEDEPEDEPAEGDDDEYEDDEEFDDDDEDDEEFREIDDDLIDLDDEWDEKDDEERHDNPHRYYE